MKGITPAIGPMSGFILMAPYDGASSLDVFRSRLWVMLTFAIQCTRNDKEQEMDKFIFLFERLNDLITACYAITTTPQLSTIIQNS